MRLDRLARLHGAVDRQAGERVHIVPYTVGDYVVGAPDPSRPAQVIVAEVTDVAKTARTQGPGATSGHNVELRTASHTIKFTTTALPYELGEADRVVLLDRGGHELKVNSTDPFGTDRTVARLEPLKKATS
ncbi:hypothetical protein [Jatrophihabitans endophyticus]|uniref:hypothetical protein n=1 Tax=Jatrophihabitans endophyticus TaxID=1206085 RepID=UPI0019FDF5B8|nr:hypothetical protein [Jatrophihabitans endophyticus]MBE7190804.1 hypothetical protein [Jatrophihabitans endophyticus]